MKSLLSVVVASLLMIPGLANAVDWTVLNGKVGQFSYNDQAVPGIKGCKITFDGKTLAIETVPFSYDYSASVDAAGLKESRVPGVYKSSYNGRLGPGQTVCGNNIMISFDEVVGVAPFQLAISRFYKCNFTRYEERTTCTFAR